MLTPMLATLLYALLLMSPQECTYSADCLASECAVADSARGGQKCVPRQKVVMVWPANEKCLEKIELGPKARMEAPVVDGEPDMSQAVILQAVATYKKNCGRIEIRNIK